MTIAAHNREARLGKPQLRSDHVDDAALGTVHAIQWYTEFSCVDLHLLDLRGSHCVGNRQGAVMRWDRMIHGGDGFIGTAYL